MLPCILNVLVHNHPFRRRNSWVYTDDRVSSVTRSRGGAEIDTRQKASSFGQ